MKLEQQTKFSLVKPFKDSNTTFSIRNLVDFLNGFWMNFEYDYFSFVFLQLWLKSFLPKLDLSTLNLKNLTS